MSKPGKVFLIPSLLAEEGVDAIPSYITKHVLECSVFFVENERTARRYLKKLWITFLPGQHIEIDNYEWYAIHKAEKEMLPVFRKRIKEGRTIGIISEAGCPGIADPGQLLIAAAHDMNAQVKPLVGPNSILLALAASGMNGQRFSFAGYLPIDSNDRIKTIRELESESLKENTTQIFIETPYRNNPLVEALLRNCKPSTQLCIAVDLTSPDEWIKTKKVLDWQKEKVDIHKRPAIFLLLAG